MKYTMTNGIEVTLTRKQWKNIKRDAKSRFDGSEDLFNACWKKYCNYLNGAIDQPADIDGVMSWLESIASEFVNNSKSRFYIYG